MHESDQEDDVLEDEAPMVDVAAAGNSLYDFEPSQNETLEGILVERRRELVERKR
jgi:hypothetical protein